MPDIKPSTLLTTVLIGGGLIFIISRMVKYHNKIANVEYEFTVVQ